MPWVLIDDSFPQHPKIAAIGPLGIALQVAGLCYCNRELTDGFIPRAIAATLLNWEQPLGEEWAPIEIGGTRPTWLDVANTLVAAGVWDRVPSGYLVHDYADYQPSKDQVKASRSDLSAVRSEAGKRGAAARWGAMAKSEFAIPVANSKQAEDTGENGKPIANSMATGKQTDSPNPNPNKLSNKLDNGDVRAKAEKRGTRIDPDWHLTEEQIHWSLAEGMTVAEVRRAAAEFFDYWTSIPGARGRKIDWAAVWRNRVRDLVDRKGRRPGPGDRPTIMRNGRFTPEYWRMRAEEESDDEQQAGDATDRHDAGRVAAASLPRGGSEGLQDRPRRALSGGNRGGPQNGNPGKQVLPKSG